MQYTAWCGWRCGRWRVIRHGCLGWQDLIIVWPFISSPRAAISIDFNRSTIIRPKLIPEYFVPSPVRREKKSMLEELYALGHASTAQHSEPYNNDSPTRRAPSISKGKSRRTQAIGSFDQTARGRSLVVHAPSHNSDMPVMWRESDQTANADCVD
jgi:hypothetical protein